jgi:hypothetical protein
MSVSGCSRRFRRLRLWLSNAEGACLWSNGRIVAVPTGAMMQTDRVAPDLSRDPAFRGAPRPERRVARYWVPPSPQIPSALRSVRPCVVGLGCCTLNEARAPFRPAPDATSGGRGTERVRGSRRRATGRPLAVTRRRTPRHSRAPLARGVGAVRGRTEGRRSRRGIGGARPGRHAPRRTTGDVGGGGRGTREVAQRAREALERTSPRNGPLRRVLAKIEDDRVGRAVERGHPFAPREQTQPTEDRRGDRHLDRHTNLGRVFQHTALPAAP